MNGFSHFLVLSKQCNPQRQAAAKTKLHHCYCLAIISPLDVLHYYNYTLTPTEIS